MFREIHFAVSLIAPFIQYEFQLENIEAIVRGFEDEYAAALVALFTEDTTIVTERGDVVAGRAAFAQSLKRAFAVVPSHLEIENTPSHTVGLTGDVVVSHGRSRKFSGSSGGEEQLIYTRVLVRQGQEWRLAANHVAQPSSQPEPRATSQ